MYSPLAMLLFQKRFHAGLLSGEITLTFRRWARTHVRAGGRYRCHPIGVLEVTDVREVCVDEISETDANSTGFPTRAELLEYMASASDAPLSASSKVFRVQLRHAGDGDRVALALEAELSADDVATIGAKLSKLDAKRAWTQKTLAIIAERPRVAASQLAAALGYKDKLEFKEEVRKLKKLGLTQSFEVGYEVSPRGRAYMAATAGRKPKRAARPKTQSPARKSSSSSKSPRKASGRSVRG